MKAVALFSLVTVVVCKKSQPHAVPAPAYVAYPRAAGPNPDAEADPHYAYPFGYGYGHQNTKPKTPTAPHSYYYGKRDAGTPKAPAVHEVGGGAPAVTGIGAIEPNGAYDGYPAAPVALEPHFYYNKRDAGYPGAPQAASVLAAVAPAYGSYGHAYGYPYAPYTHYNKREAPRPAAPHAAPVPAPAYGSYGQAVAYPPAVRYPQQPQATSNLFWQGYSDLLIEGVRSGIFE